MKCHILKRFEKVLHWPIVNIIDNKKFVLLYDLHKSRSLDISHTDFAKFDLENCNDDQCYANFRFLKKHVYELRERLNIPEKFYVTIMSLWMV